MKCRNCKRKIEDNSIYCNWCGAKQIREKEEVSVPVPRKIKSGYTAQIMIDGKRQTVTAKTEKEYYQQARELKKAGAIKTAPTLGECIKTYISNNSAVLSPSTLRGYEFIQKRLEGYSNNKVDEIDYQALINNHAKTYKSKTIRNTWGLIAAALDAAGQQIPKINLPAKVPPQTEFLDHAQIKTFIRAIQGEPIEIPALLALHSLRASEIRHLQREDIDNKVIHVRGATVMGPAGKVSKDANKTEQSTRDIPVIIPRLTKILPEAGPVSTLPDTNITRRIATICKHNNLPVCSLHDLRRTFASLAAYLGWREETICAVGGWIPGSAVVHRVYIKVSDKAITEDVNKMKRFLK